MSQTFILEVTNTMGICTLVLPYKNLLVSHLAGHCCVMYQVCAGDADAFTLDGAYDPANDPLTSDVDATCTTDFIGIEGLKYFNFTCGKADSPYLDES